MIPTRKGGSRPKKTKRKKSVAESLGKSYSRPAPINASYKNLGDDHYRRKVEKQRPGNRPGGPTSAWSRLSKKQIEVLKASQGGKHKRVIGTIKRRPRGMDNSPGNELRSEAARDWQSNYDRISEPIGWDEIGRFAEGLTDLVTGIPTAIRDPSAFNIAMALAPGGAKALKVLGKPAFLRRLLRDEETINIQGRPERGGNDFDSYRDFNIQTTPDPIPYRGPGRTYRDAPEILASAAISKVPDWGWDVPALWTRPEQRGTTGLLEALGREIDDVAGPEMVKAAFLDPRFAAHAWRTQGVMDKAIMKDVLDAMGERSLYDLSNKELRDLASTGEFQRIYAAKIREELKRRRERIFMHKGSPGLGRGGIPTGSTGDPRFDRLLDALRGI